MVDFNSFLGGLGGGAVVSIIIRAVDDYSKELDAAGNKVAATANKMKVSWVAVAGAVVAGAAVLVDFAKEAAKAGDVAEQFNRVVGVKGVQVLRDLQKETLGTVDKWELMAAASSAVNRGIEAESLPTLARFAQQLQDAGIEAGSVTEILDSMTGAISTGRLMALKHMGVMVDADQVYKEFAVSVGKTVKALSEEEKQGALTTAVLAEIAKKSKEMAAPTEDAADKINQLTVKWKEFKVQVGTVVSPAIVATIDALQKIIGVMEIQNTLVNGIARKLLGIKQTVQDTLTEDNAILESRRLTLAVDQLAKDQLTASLEMEKLRTIELLRQEETKRRAFEISQREANIRVAKLQDMSYKAEGSNVRLNPRRVNDFIITKTGQLIETHPDDTLFGTKNFGGVGGKGVTVYIENLNGLNPDAIADALQRKLSTMVTI